jgi:hypothetical protein
MRCPRLKGQGCNNGLLGQGYCTSQGALIDEYKNWQKLFVNIMSSILERLQDCKTDGAILFW